MKTIFLSLFVGSTLVSCSSDTEGSNKETEEIKSIKELKFTLGKVAGNTAEVKYNRSTLKMSYKGNRREVSAWPE